MFVRTRILLFNIMLLLLVLLIGTAEAANPLDSLVAELQRSLQSGSLAVTLTSMATSLFIILATLQIAWNFIQLTADGKFEMQAIISTLVRQIIFIGFFYWLLRNGIDFFTLIVSSFYEKGLELSGVSSITDIFTVGVNTASGLLSAAWDVTPALHLVPVFLVVGPSALIILMAFTLATFVTIVTICKTYIACTVGVYFLGFGGNSYTKDIAINAAKVCYVSGVELFVILLLVGIGNNLFTEFLDVSRIKNSGESIYNVTFQVLVAAFVYSGCVRTLPTFISSIVTGGITGASSGASNAAGTMISTAGAVAIGGGAALLGGAIGAAGGHTASERIGGFAKGAMGGGIGSVGQVAREAGSNVIRNAFGNHNNVSPE